MSPQSPPAAGRLTGGAPLGRSVTGQITIGSPRSDGSEVLSEDMQGKEPYKDERPLTKVSLLFHDAQHADN
jgi:hypothetical protein